MWINGLKYKIINLELPTILQKTLCNFLDERTARIKIGIEFSNDINILSGVPQGSVLSPTMYTIFTNDLPPPSHGCLDILYADDVTQIITSQSKSKNMMKLKVEREIERINRYEKKWKIKTSQEKFKLIPIAQLKTKPIVVNGQEIPNSKEGKVLGLKLQRSGIVGHVSNLKNKANAVLTKLRRFSYLTPRLKTTLVKTLLLPIIEYPIIPLCTISVSQKKNLQVILNKALRFINCNDFERLYIAEELHNKYNIKPINVNLHTKAKKIWQTIKDTEPEHYNQITQDFGLKHSWFPKSSNIISAETPAPIYTSG